MFQRGGGFCGGALFLPVDLAPQGVVGVDVQAVARVAQAGDAVYVVVETPRRPYGEECARPLHDGALRQPRRTSGRRFEYFEPEGAVGNVIARELGMRMDAGPVAVFQLITIASQPVAGQRPR